MNFNYSSTLLFQLCKSDAHFRILIDLLKYVAVCDDEGKYLLSERKNGPLFACIELSYTDASKIFKRGVTRPEIVKAFCLLLQINAPAKVSRASIAYPDARNRLEPYLEKLINELDG